MPEAIAPLTPEEIAQFRVVVTKREWNAAMAEVRYVRGGKMPPDWYATIITGGIARGFNKRNAKARGKRMSRGPGA